MKEREIQDAFAAWLRERGIPFLRSRMDRATTIAVGWPDFTICYRGRVLLIETKVRGTGHSEGLSARQLKKHIELGVAGCPPVIAYSFEECVAATLAWMEGGKLAGGAVRNGKSTLRLVQWAGIDVVVDEQTAGDATFVRLAEARDMTLPRL